VLDQPRPGLPFSVFEPKRSAKKIVALRTDDALQQRVDELADKANRGEHDCSK